MHLDAVRAAGMLGVPGLRNIDFSLATGVSVLALHSTSDRLVVDSHQRVHGSLAVVGVPHEMVEFGGVAPNYFDESGSGWSADTSADTDRRLLRWFLDPPRVAASPSSQRTETRHDHG